MRRLTLVPIVHSDADLGRLAGAVWRRKTESLGREAAEASREQVARYWDALEETLNERFEDLNGVTIYQDGLPVAKGMERKIVEDLAGQGSVNHQLLLRMLDRGAELVGAESPELLIREYQQARLVLAGDGPTGEAADSAAQNLIAERDRFIADRIDQTLPNDGPGLLLIGMLHDVAAQLPEDIEVETLVPAEFQAA